MNLFFWFSKLELDFQWIWNPDERPSFDHICSILKSDFDYITEDVNKEIFQQNVRFNEESDVQFYFIDKTNKTFDTKERILGMSEFINDKKKIIKEDAEDTKEDEMKDQNGKKIEESDIITKTPNYHWLKKKQILK